MKRSKLTLTLLCLIASVTTCYAGAKKPALNFPGITAGFCIQKPDFWTNAQPSTEILRIAVFQMLDSGRYLGLNSNRYHLSNIRELLSYTAIDANDAKLLEAYYTDALVTYCMDLVRSPEINDWVWYDEIGDKYNNKIKEKLLGELLSLRSLSDLRELVRSVQPQNEEYRTLVHVLNKQITDQNSVNIRKLSVSLAYYRWAHFFNFQKLIVVNIASAHLKYYEASTIKLEMKVVVGKPSTKTPRFSAHCDQVILYPYWHVPRSIAVNEILPACKRSAAVINIMNLEVLNNKGTKVDPYSINWKAYSKSNFPYTFRQSTGCDNALGVIKFNITDPFNVYLHDTNMKTAFSSKRRYFSHGCIRVEKPVELANYILPRELDNSFLKACVKRQKPVPMSLDPVPVFVTYMPAEVDSTGNVVYLEDIYQLL
jgi:murein L,D-transpeptidase YcbB/YkuD